MKTKIILLYLLILASSISLKAQNCNNLGFENGSFSNWEAWTGNMPWSISQNTSPTMTTQGFVASRHQITSGTGMDIWTNNAIPVVSPNGGGFSCQLGNAQAASQAEQLRQTFLVTPDLTSYVYQYAVVFEDPGHVGRPTFEIKIYDQNDSIIPCGEYIVRGDQGIPGFVSTSVTFGMVHWIIYKDWTEVAVDLTPYLGDSVTVEFSTGDCSAGQHFGYAYIDGYCQTLEIDAQSNCSNDYTLTAPNGYQYYSWSNGMNGQSINITGASAGDSITVSLTPFMGCPTEITYYYGAPSPVVANFSMGSGCIGDQINFNDLSTPDSLVTNWSWDFGDGNTSSLENPTHTYAASGNFDVTLMVSSNGGCSDTLIQPITICGNGGVEFLAEDICEQNTATFTDLSINIALDPIVSWFWDFNDGATSALQNPTHFYLNEGVYNVQLYIVYTSGIIDSITHSISVNPVPYVGFVANEVCLGQVTNFTSVAIISSGQIDFYDWEFGNGATGTGDVTSTLYSNVGVNIVKHTVTSDRGCVNSISNPIGVYAIPNVEIEISNPFDCEPLNTDISAVCQGSQDTLFVEEFDMIFLANSSYTSQPTLPGVEYILYVSGNYNVWGDSRIVDAAYLDSSGSISQTGLFANGLLNGARPTPDIYNGITHSYVYPFTGDGSSIDFAFNDPNLIDNYGQMHYSIYRVLTPCEGYTYNWNLGNGNSLTADSLNTTYTIPGTYTIQLSVDNSFTGCSFSIEDSVIVYPNPIAEFTVENACSNSPVQITNNSSVSSGNITNLIWEMGDGSGLFNNMTSYSFNSEGIYSITLITETDQGCRDTTVADVTVNPNPLVSFTGTPLFGCAPLYSDFNDLSTISSGNIVSWSWDFGDGNTSLDQNPYNTFEESGLYNVSLVVVSDSGCIGSNTYSEYIEVYSNPVAEFSFDPTNPDVYHPVVNFEDESTDANFWSWQFDELGVSNQQNPQFSFENDGQYDITLTITNLNGCVDSITHTVIVDPIYSLFIPNAFTPDGYGNNETFFAQGENIIEFEMLIFDRWGTLLFETNSIDGSWDGTYQGSPVQQDVYVYKVNIKDINNGRHELFGHISLLR